MSIEAMKCTGCGKLPREVFTMIALPPPDVAICSECVALCAEIVGEKWAATAHHIAKLKTEIALKD